jgi:hypothetical protein
MRLLDAAEKVLQASTEPLDAEEITRRALDAGYIATDGKTPAASMEAGIAVDIRRRSKASPFQRTGPGMFALRAWGLPEHLVSRSALPVQHADPAAVDLVGNEEAPTVEAPETPATADWVFQVNPARFDVEAAVKGSVEGSWSTPRYRDRLSVGQRVWLTAVGKSEPGVRYIATITSPVYEKADEWGTWKVDIRYEYRVAPVLTRAELMADPLLRDVYALRGFLGTNAPLTKEVGDRLWELVQGRLVVLGSGAGVSPESVIAVDKALERHNLEVRRQLKAAIAALTPDDFEHFVVRVLEEMGFDVEHTGKTNDGGVDAEAMLSLQDLTSVKTKVQAKRWAHTVGGKTVRELRGALKVDERGLIITTAEFSAEARKEAVAEGKARIGLVGGEDLARRCAELGIGVIVRQVPFLKLDADRLLGEPPAS